MEATPRPVIDSVVRTVCGGRVERLFPLTSGGLNEAYRVELDDNRPVIVRIARRGEPWFTGEEQAIVQARRVGVPGPDVVGVEHVDHEGELLSFSVLRLLPGRPLIDLAGELPAPDVERLVIDSGELLARLHSVVADGAARNELRAPEDGLIARVVGVAHEALGPAAATVVERGAHLLGQQVMTRAAPAVSLTHGDFLPKHLLIGDEETIVGVIDREFAGAASPAVDLAHWEVAAGGGLHDRADLVRHGYARVADPDTADGGWVPAFAIGFALDVLSWRNPASPERIKRCVDVISRHVGDIR